MNEEMKKFLTALKDDKELSDKLEETCDRIFKEGKINSGNEAFVSAAKELGFQISLADLEKISTEEQELDTDALDDVAGGDLTRILRQKYLPQFLPRKKNEFR